MASVYAGSRVLMSLAEQRMAPRCFAYVDKAGRPLWAVVSVLIWFPLAYINLASVGDQVFTWLLAASGLATIFSWLSISIAHIRFRMAWKAQGHSVDELPFHSIGGIWGSVFAATILILVLGKELSRKQNEGGNELIVSLFSCTILRCRLADW